MRKLLPGLLTLALGIPGVAASAQSLPGAPAQPPVATANSEPWYQAGSALIFRGYVYDPAGAQVFFNENEMTRVGHFGTIPLYTKTTVEPNSLVLVPLASGLMQPYQRRRAGELAGAVGSSAPVFAEYPPQIVLVPGFADARTLMAPSGAAAAVGTDSSVPQAVATSGVVTGRRQTGSPAGEMTTAEKPEGLNGIFIQFNNRRWFSSGPAVTFESSRFTKIGSYEGRPVYVERSTPGTIFVPAADAADSPVAPFSRTRPVR